MYFDIGASPGKIEAGSLGGEEDRPSDHHPKMVQITKGLKSPSPEVHEITNHQAKKFNLAPK